MTLDSAPIRPPRFRLLGARVDALTVPDLHRIIERAVREDGSAIIAHLNLHGAYLYPRVPAMKALLEKADWVHIDGMALVAWGRLLGHPLRREHRVTYLDWLDPLLAEACGRGWRVFYLGAKPGIAEEGAALLRERYPGLEIITHHGFFDTTAGSAENQAVLHEIARYRPNVLMVGMGMPRQEHWILENADELAAHVVLPCGACIDYVAGALPIPPRWMGRVGLEWLFRLIAEPRRLGRRYLVEPWGLVGAMGRDVRARVAAFRGG
jgi:N-acetylglucosaminyldiphosphoundecaprenol N-acetyl-beta-D-mannosaminyltransferase